MLKHFTYISLIVSLFSAPTMAADMFIQSEQAKLMATPAFKGEVLLTLDKGTKVGSLKEEGRWIQVQSGESIGWISKFLLGNTPPLQNKVETILDKTTSDPNQVRRRASTVTTAGAARGLTAEDRRRNKEAGDNYQALESMEKATVSDEELNQFNEALEQ